MIPPSWKDYIIRHHDLIVMVIIIVMLLGPGLLFTYKYVSENSPQSRKPLVIHMNSLSVSNFGITTSKLGAEWVANLTFANRDKDFEIYIEPFQTFVYYKERYAVSCASVEPIRLRKRKQKTILIEFNTTACWANQPYEMEIGAKVLKEIWDDKEKGRVRVSLKMYMEHGEYHKGIDRWDLDLKPSCSDVEVDFLDATDEGRFLGNELYCSIPW